MKWNWKRTSATNRTESSVQSNFYRRKKLKSRKNALIIFIVENSDRR